MVTPVPQKRASAQVEAQDGSTGASGQALRFIRARTAASQSFGVTAMVCVKLPSGEGSSGLLRLRGKRGAGLESRGERGSAGSVAAEGTILSYCSYKAC